MLDFVKRLFHLREKEVTLLLMEEDAQESSSSFRFRPQNLWWLWSISIVVTVTVILLLVIFTPLGSALYDRQDAMLREQVVEVSQKVLALQDSLQVRDSQLLQMQQVIISGDSSFAVEENFSRSPAAANRAKQEQNLFSEVQPKPEVSENEIIFSETFQKVPEFPADYPVDGTLTRSFGAENGHYGIDIATQSGTSFTSIADGVVINQEWTINYGYVVHVQHNGGILTIYKHAASLSKSIGDIVLQGDILGTTGNTGIMSTGSHLHLEIWKNGVPQNPNTYLLK